MSSEESGMDNEDEVLKVNSLPWRAEKVNRMFHHLDNEAGKCTTPQSRRQKKRRVDGGISERLQPAELDIPNWTFKTTR